MVDGVSDVADAGTSCAVRDKPSLVRDKTSLETGLPVAKDVSDVADVGSSCAVRDKPSLVADASALVRDKIALVAVVVE